MNIGTITFHAAHNYGSVLQAYALQSFIVSLLHEYGIDGDYNIINYRSKLQKGIYGVPHISNISTFIKRMMYVRYKHLLSIQDNKFEEFISDYLNITEEFSREDELSVLTKKYDVLIAGSDQIWNIRAKDFSFSYLFEGCFNKKVSYAASLGPLIIDWNLYDKERYLKLLKEFSSISVREDKSKQMIESLFDSAYEVCVNVDPTLLISVDEWRKIQSEMIVNGGKFILFYCLEPTIEHLRIAKLVSKQYGLPVVATRYRNKYDFFNPFIKQYDAGPLDFLSLIDNAELVLTSSFHGTAFSLIYGKPFYAIDGMKDSRISNILSRFSAIENSIDINCLSNITQAKAVDVSNYIRDEIKQSKNYFIRALNL